MDSIGGFPCFKPRRWLSVIVAALAFTLVPVVALASHYGQLVSGHPDDTVHTMWWTTTLTPTWVNVVNWNRTNNIDPTIFQTAWLPAHGEGSDVVDMSIWNEDLGSFAGATSCIVRDTIDSIKCLHKHVRFNHVVPLTYDQQRKVGCHELGHTVALGHRFENTFVSCMKQGVSTFMWLDSHDDAQINGHDPPGWDDNIPPQHVY